MIQANIRAAIMTPWGRALAIRHLEPGLMFLKADKGGGYMVAEGFAKKRLSAAARQNGRYQLWQHYYCYEQATRWAIVCYEFPEYFAEFFKGCTDIRGTNPQKYLKGFLSQWHPDYLLEREIKPDAEAYRQWRIRADKQSMQEAGSPDLIVQMEGPWASGQPGVYVVHTGDGETHFVTEPSYEKQGELKLLSKCVKHEPKLPRKPVS